MKITVIGTGNVGCTIAADLTRKGHRVSLLKTSTVAHSDNFEALARDKTFQVRDPYIGDYSVRFTNIFDRDYAKALESAEVILFTIQTNYHKEVIKSIVPFLKDGQTIIFEPGYLSTCFLLEICHKDILVIEGESSPIDCRIIQPGMSQVLFKNVLNPIGVFPNAKKNEASTIMESLGFPFRFTKSVIEAALHNPNLIVHTVGALFSIPRIEYTKGDYWMYREVFTPHVWTICESLDQEKLMILERLGITDSLSYVEACQERNYIDDPRTPLESFFDYALHSSPKGPSTPDSRYLTEDVSQGLVMMESLGAFLGIPTPTSTSLITLASTALGRDFREEGRTVDSLGKESIRRIIADSC